MRIEKLNIWKIIISFILAAGFFILLWNFRFNPYSMTALFFMGSLLPFFIFYFMGLRGTVLYPGGKTREQWANIGRWKYGAPAVLSGLSLSAISFFVMDLPMVIWAPVMFIPYIIAFIFFPIIFYDEEKEEYRDISFLNSLILSLSIGFAILCILTGAYFLEKTF